MATLTANDQDLIVQAAELLKRQRDDGNATARPRITLVQQANLLAAAGGNWGPERNAPLNRAYTTTVSVPGNRIARVTFSFNAWYENAILIYDEATSQLLCERGNGPYRHAQDWASDIAPDEKRYLITGWHKNGPANHRLPWIQSPNRVFIDTSHFVQVGFEDAGQDDYDDALCSWTVTNR